MSTLSEIQHVVQQFAEVTSAALKVNVEVIDDQLYRIAGTGITKDLIGNKIQDKGIISRFLFKDTKKIIIEDPGKEENCAQCPKYGSCLYKRAVYAAIVHEDKTIGVMGITAMNEEQISSIEYNNYAMLDFVDEVGELISAKVREDQMLNQIKAYAQLMNSVVDNITKGLIILNKEGVICEINQYILEKINITKEASLGRHISHILPGMTLVPEEPVKQGQGYQEIIYSAKDKQIYLLCQLKPILINNEAEMTICMIEDYKDTKNMAYAISEKQNEIYLNDIIGSNIGFVRFKEKVKNVAEHDSTVLLTGETGTGKELFARAIHYQSSRRNKPLVAINCGAIPESLIESELFGYEKGAFTGANHMGKHGKFYMADKGTIFLDEVETMPLYLQPKLLRVIENREIERIGGIKSIPIDIRIVAASNIPLIEMVEKGLFREDLYHRLNVVSLFIPPLRDRGEDVLVLADYFIHKFAARFNKYILALSPEVRQLFLNYPWKGNVRELQNTIEYAINMVQSNFIGEESLPPHFKEVKTPANFLSLEEIEKEHIKKALDQFGLSEDGRIKAAKNLGISRATIYRKIKKYELA